MYESQVTFIFDTICPWTFLAKKRLDQALAQVRATTPPVTFTLHFDPYQLTPDLPASIPSRREWQLHHKHLDNPDAQAAYHAHMSSLFEPLGVTLRQDGELGNTLHAHRVVQYFQESRGEDVAGRIVDGLYRRYFSEGRHPSAGDTLVESCVEARVPEGEAREVVADESKGEREVKAKIRSVGMDVDAVPVVVVEGKRRDITLTGAKEVSGYVKALETVIKESA